MYKLVIYFFLFLIYLFGCSGKSIVTKNSNIKYEKMSFDVVEKQLIIENNFPVNLKNELTDWFNNNILVDGIDGKITFTISNYEEKISELDNGKKVNLSLAFKAIIEKKSFAYKKIIKGNVEAFSEISGEFSIKDFESLVSNTQLDLIVRLSRNLKSKI